MDTDKDLEMLLRRAKFTTTAAEDARILADASAALACGGERPAALPTPTSPSQSSVRAKRLATLALPPAAVAATILIALFAWKSSPEITWAQVVETVRKKPWMHFVFKEMGPDSPATETWYSEEHGILALKSPGSLIFNDRNNNITEKCDPRPMLVQKKSDPRPIRVQNRIYRYSPMTQDAETSFLMGALFDAAMSGDTKTAIEVREGARFARFVPQGESKAKHDGQSLLEYRFELVLAIPDPKAKPLRITIQVDPETRLPQRWTTWIRDNGPWFVQTESAIDYPPSGPKDIYELGAPRTADIVNGN